MSFLSCVFDTITLMPHLLTTNIYLSGFISNTSKALTVISVRSKEIEENIFVKKKYNCFRNINLIPIPERTC